MGPRGGQEISVMSPSFRAPSARILVSMFGCIDFVMLSIIPPGEVQLGMPVQGYGFPKHSQIAV